MRSLSIFSLKSSNSWQSIFIPFTAGLLCGVIGIYICNDAGAKKEISDDFAIRFHSSRLTYENSSAKQTTEAALASENREVENSVHLLCWIVVSPDAHSKTRFVKNTWAKKCDTVLFMSSVSDPTVPTVHLNLVNDTYKNLWGKTKASLKYIYDHHLQDADWFFKADLDTYVIIENLRVMLSSFDSSIPWLFGRRFQQSATQSFYSGGAGYVLTKEAIRRFVENKPDIGCRKEDEGAEDVLLTTCMEKVGVQLGDSRDEFGLQRFNSHNLLTALTHFSNTGHYFSPANDFYPNNGSRHSSRPISFHYVREYEQLLYDFLLYNVSVQRDAYYADYF